MQGEVISPQVIFSNTYTPLGGQMIQASDQMPLVRWGEQMIAFYDSRFKIREIKLCSFYGK